MRPPEILENTVICGGYLRVEKIYTFVPFRARYYENTACYKVCPPQKKLRAKNSLPVQGSKFCNTNVQFILQSPWVMIDG